MRMRPPLTRGAVVLATAFLSAGAVGPVSGAAAAEVDETAQGVGSGPVLLLSQLSDEDLEDKAQDLEDAAEEAAEAAAEEAEESQDSAEKAAKKAAKAADPDESEEQAKPDEPQQTDDPVDPEQTQAPVPAPVPDADPQTNDPGETGSPSPDPTPAEKPTPVGTPDGKPQPGPAPGKAAAPATGSVDGNSSGRGPAADAQPAGDRRNESDRDLTGGPTATSAGRGTGAADRAPSSPRPLLECLDQTASASEGCDEQVLAGLSGPGDGQDGASASGQRSEAFELFDADPDLVARAQHRTRAVDGVAGSQAAWSEMGAGELLLITIIPPLALLVLGYVALGRRYP